jgi:hypothetical protein
MRLPGAGCVPMHGAMHAWRWALPSRRGIALSFFGGRGRMPYGKAARGAALWAVGTTETARPHHRFERENRMHITSAGGPTNKVAREAYVRNGKL